MSQAYAQSFPAQYANLLQRAEYRFFSGDINGDGWIDVLAKAKTRLVLIDFEPAIPVPLKPPSPTFMLLSDSSGQYSLVSNPPAATVASPIWRPDSHDVLFGDIDGNGSVAMLVRARVAGEPSFVVVTSSSNGAPLLRQHLTAAATGVDVSGPSISLTLEDTNADGRADLIVRTDGRISMVLAANSSGLFSAPDNAEERIIVGNAAGAASVTASGSAQYEIPIWVPPGTAGMQPALALRYDHRSSEVLAGLGWRIAGLSRIVRCPRTWAQDGQARNVRSDAQDRFCLDGARLRLVSGTYGAHGAEYRTELESFARIRSYGTAGTGPAYFVVESKDGRIYEYGNTVDSRIEFVGQTNARAWAVNRVRDRSGNTMSFSYSEDVTHGAYRISSIQYASNAAQNLSSAYSVAFSYEPRPSGDSDSIYPSYMAGSPMVELTRLSRIDVNYNSDLVRRYQLAYEPSLSPSGRSRLASVQQCAAGTPLECLPATTFSYQNGGVGLHAQTATGALVPTSISAPLAIDVNGDGRDDLVYVSNATAGAGHWMVMLATSAGFSAPVNTGVVNTQWEGAIPIDYNADARVDLLVPFNGSSWWVMLGGPGGLSAPANLGVPVTPGAVGSNAAAADMNGDGLEDLVWMDHNAVAIRYRARELSGTFSSTVTDLIGPMGSNYALNGNLTTPFGQYSRRRLPDFDGDGRAELAFAFSYSVYDGESGQTITEDYWHLGGVDMAIVPTMSFPRFLDFDGDRKDDLVYTNNGLWCRRSGTGDGFSAASCSGSTSGFNVTQLVVLDWNGDGREDFLVPYAPAGTWYLNATTNTGLAVSAGWIGATVGDFNGDAQDDIGYTSDGAWVYRTHIGPYPDHLLSATDSLNNTITFNYAPLPSANYSAGTGASYPAQDYREPLYVVNSYNAPNGIGGTFKKTFYYSEARVNLQGRGFQGFLARRSHDSRTGLYTYEYYNRDFPYTGTRYQQTILQSNLITTVEQTADQYTSHSYGSGTETRYLPYLLQRTVTQYELGGSYNGQLMRSSVTRNSVDAATGAIYDSTTTVTEPSGANGVQNGASYVSRTYTPLSDILNDTSNWCIGRARQVQRINLHNQYGGGSMTQIDNLSWDAAACRLTHLTAEPGNTQLQVTTALGYDGFGNIDSTTVTGVDMTPRTTAIHWGGTGQFPTSVTNALSQTAELGWNYALGALTSQSDPNGTVISWMHDGFGRLARETRPDGTYTIWDYEPSYGSCDPRARYFISERQYASGGAQIVYTRLDRDAFERPINEYTTSFSGGAYETTTRTYNALGLVASEGTRYLSGGCSSYTAPYTATFQYDSLGRMTQISRPISDSDPTAQSTSIYFEGLQVRVVDAESNESAKTFNVAGGLARSMDHDGYYQQFDYDAFGNPIRVTDSSLQVLQSNTFNVRGMRTAHSDMDAGSMSFTPNALGEIVAQTNANGQPTTFVYDLLGRLTSRSEMEGTSTFTFGTSAAANNIGRLQSIAGRGYSEAYQYDGIGRLVTRTIQSDATYTIDYRYNSIGALDTLTYPESTAGYRLKLQYDYQAGRLYRVRDYNAPATVFWTANDMDAQGHVIDETLGNGIRTVSGYDAVTGLMDYLLSGPNADGTIQNLSYTWDRVGNLIQRQDVRQGLSETFGYDHLYRLTSVSGPSPLTIGYDAMGNITSRSDIGSYGYHATRKHLATAAGGTSFSYDAAGNVTSRGSTRINWYSYHLPAAITGASSNSSQFFYTPARARWKQAAVFSGVSETTIYVGGLMEKVTRAGRTNYRHYIAGGNGPVAIHNRHTDGSTNGAEIRYLTRDHQGSIDSITDAAGSVLVRESFGAFGDRRNEATWSGAVPSADMTHIAAATRHGYTFHDMLDNVKLVHMNGRVYDPAVGRFLSADPFIDGVGNTQGWNRYSYVRNNPLSLVDPSGFGVKENGDHRESEGTGGSYWDFNMQANPYSEVLYDVNAGVSVDHHWNTGPTWYPAYGPPHLRAIRDALSPVAFGPGDSHVTSTGESEPSPNRAVGGAGLGSTVGGFGLQMSARTRGGSSYLINEEPSELAELRRNHPGWRLLEDEMWSRSVPSSFGLFLQRIPFLGLTGGAREHGFFVYQSLSSPDRLRFDLIVAGAESNRISGTFRVPQGYRLLAVFHTHPFAFSPSGAQRGPSDGRPGLDDFDTARMYPDAFHYIRALGPISAPYPGEWYYYGQRAGVP